MATAEAESALSVVERAKLENLESCIQTGLKSFIDVGRALMEIRDGRLYRATHMNFEDYCRERWDMTRQYAHLLVSGVQVVDSLSTTVDDDQLPTSERQVRPLASLPEEDRAAAWKEAVETAPNGKVTASHVEEIVKSRLPGYEPEEDEPHKKNGHKKKVADDNQAKADAESQEVRNTFLERLDKVCDGGVYTLDSLSKAFASKDSAKATATWFIRQCEVSPAVKVHRNYGRKGLVQYSFEKTKCVTGHSRIRQLAQQISTDDAATARIRSAAVAILSLLGG